MKNIIIYGVTNIRLRREIEYYLSDEYIITGYSDTYYKEDVIDQKRYIPSKDICKEEFDYIVLAAEAEAAQMAITNYLEELGIERDKIVTPVILLEKQFAGYSYLVNDVCENCKGDFQGLIFGLSYSRKGIIKKRLLKPFYDFSRDGMDLYYNMKIYEYALQRQGFPHAAYALCVFPYYYFNYDMSKSLAQYKTGQIFAMQGLKDWHNYTKCVGGGHKIGNYVANFKIFGEKYAKFYESKNYQPIIREVIHKDDMLVLGKIWHHEYKETVAENSKLFHEFIALLKGKGMQIVIVVPPMYLKNCREEDKKAVERKKKEFYKNMEQWQEDGSVVVKDYTNLYEENREYFYNPDHLNLYGSERFTEVINREIIKEIFESR